MPKVTLFLTGAVVLISKIVFSDKADYNNAVALDVA